MAPLSPTNSLDHVASKSTTKSEECMASKYEELQGKFKQLHLDHEELQGKFEQLHLDHEDKSNELVECQNDLK